MGRCMVARERLVMGSESRQRTRIVTVRVYESEYDYIAALADQLGCSRAEIARAKIFDRPPVPAPMTMECMPTGPVARITASAVPRVVAAVSKPV